MRRPFRIRRLAALALLLAALCAAALVYAVNPSEQALTLCLLNALTGLYCPGCGNTRALHHLLHGDIAAAARMNLFFVCAIVPLGLWLALSRGLMWLGYKRHLPMPPLGAPAALSFAGALVLFGVLRNLPWFAFLAPG